MFATFFKRKLLRSKRFMGSLRYSKRETIIINKMAKVKNINGTSSTTCKCGSWLKHWENYSKQTVNFCCEKSCLNKDLVGAHVQKAGSPDSNWYIIPLCNAHNKATGEIEVSDSYKLVSANKSETCGSN